MSRILEILSRKPAQWQLRIAFFSVVVVQLLQLGYVASDPINYYERAASIVTGGIPYFEVGFEHLPVHLVPILFTWIAGGWLGVEAYRAVWVVLSSIGLVVATQYVVKVGRSIDEGIPARWILVSVPLIPIVLFRTEVWVILPVVVAMAAFVEERRSLAGIAVTVGVAAKGWPLVFSGIGWRRRWNAWSLMVGSAAVVLLGGVALTPGFWGERAFSGLHTESFGGVLWAILQLIQGRSFELIGVAGSTYLPASPTFLIPGVVVMMVVVWRLRGFRSVSLGSRELRQEFLAVGAALAAALLIFPLQSTQFLYWLVPFVAISQRRQTLVAMVLVGLLGFWALAEFEALLRMKPWWFVGTLARQFGLIYLAWVLASEASAGISSSKPSSSVT